VEAALGRLVAAGTLRPEQAAAVRRELSAGDVPAGPSSPWSARLAEVAGYVGAALTAAASLVFLGESWDDLATGSRVALLAAAAVVAFVAARADRRGRGGVLRGLRPGAALAAGGGRRHRDECRRTRDGL